MNFILNSIREHVGTGSFNRGRDYYVRQKVRSMHISEDTISGSVQGSGDYPYETEFTVEDGEITDSYCTCPVGYACKHVAALGLQAIMEMAKNPQVFTETNTRTKKPSPKGSLWVQTIASLLKEKQEQKEKQFYLQILFRIEPEYPFGYHRMNDMRKINQEKLKWKLTMRPRIFDPETKSFSVSDISWDKAFNHTIFWNGKSGILPEKHFIYLQLLGHGFRKYASGWTEILDGKEDYMWEILKQQTVYGVSLLGGTKGQIPIVLKQEPIVVKFALQETKKELVMKRKMYHENIDISEKDLAFIGNPPAFAILVEQQKYELFPLDSKTAYASHIDKNIPIPKNDITLLQHKYLPQLAKYFPLEIHTQSLTLPKTIMLQQAITVRHIKKMMIGVTFGFEYKNKSFLFTDIPEIISDESGISYIPDQQSIQKVLQIYKENSQSDPDKEIVLNNIEAARFVGETIPRLQFLLPNLIVHFPSNLPDFIFDTSVPDINFEIAEDAKENDWFDLGITVHVGEEQVPFHQLFSALVENQEYILLESGRYFPLNTEHFIKLKELLHEAKSLREATADGIKLTRFQAGLWEELQKIGIVKQQAQRWQVTMQGLLASKGVQLHEPPKNLNATLREYQQEGYSWLQFLRTYELGGILADDMGLGKTVQTIAFIASVTSKENEKKPFLVIAPTSVVENWDAELERFCPVLKRVVLHAGNRSKQFEELPAADIVILSYALLIRDFEKLEKFSFDTVILDEAQMVKNFQSKVYALVRKLKAKSKIALTGTPLENNLMELWSICSIVSPGLFPSPKQFQEFYRTPIEKQQNQSVLKKLKSRIRPFILRRQKAVVETQLPPKNEQILYLPLNDEHRHIYDLHLQQERKRVLGLLKSGGLQAHRFEILRSLTRMRQLCLHPALVDSKYENISATKLESLQEYLKELIAENHRVLIFSQFTSFLAKVKIVLQKAKYPYVYLAGETKDRGSLLKEFQQNQNIPIFLISLKAGGFGLNLTAADYCILLDPWWNPAVEQQAIDRTHRIGQTKPVFVYKMIIKDSIEEKVLKLQEKKQKLFKNIMDDESFFSSAVTEEDIKNIFT